MDTERDSLIGMFATRNGLVDPLRLAETLAEVDSEPLGDRLVHKGLLDPQALSVLRNMVDLAITKHGGDLNATIDATISDSEGSSLNAIFASDPASQVTVDFTESAGTTPTQAANMDGHLRGYPERNSCQIGSYATFAVLDTNDFPCFSS